MTETGLFKRFCGSASILLLISTGACGAPPAKPIKGEISTEIAESIAKGKGKFDHSIWDKLLSRHVRNGLVDYESFRGDRADLAEYLNRIAGADVSRLSADESKAFFINAYNALTVNAILENPGVSSIRDIDGVWTARKHSVAGYMLTLDEIEHRILRPYFEDARIHFAINCASRSCAPLMSFAFDGAELDTALESATRNALAQSEFLRIDDGAIRATRYLQWFAEDFEKAGGAREFLRRYAPVESAAIIAADTGLPIRYLDYDWNLNSVPSPRPDSQ